jgi:hypothetical protein
MNNSATQRDDPWNKGKVTGHRAPRWLRGIWAIRLRLQLGPKVRELALSNFAIDFKLRACDLVKLRVRDIFHCNHIADRAIASRRPRGRSNLRSLS